MDDNCEAEFKLIKQILAGDPSPWDILYKSHANFVINELKKMLPRTPRVDIDDEAQRVFFKAHKSLSRFDFLHPFRAWLRGIAYRCALDRLEEADRQRQLVKKAQDDSRVRSHQFGRERAPQDEAESGEEIQLLRTALEGLDSDHRDVILLREISSYSGVETAEIMGRTPVSVFRLLQHAKTQLRLALESGEDSKAESPQTGHTLCRMNRKRRRPTSEE